MKNKFQKWSVLNEAFLYQIGKLLAQAIRKQYCTIYYVDDHIHHIIVTVYTCLLYLYADQGKGKEVLSDKTFSEPTY